MTRTSPAGPDRSAWIGAASAVAAFSWWGLTPVYWKAVGAVGPYAMVAWRALWALVVLLVLLAALGRLGRLVRVLREGRTRLVLLGTASLVAVNWLLFVGAVQAGHVLDASLGYYVNPLVNVLLGVVVLKERLGRRAQVAVLLAALGVLNLAVSTGVVPWIPLALAVTFGVYGLVRKTAPVDALVGLAVETTFMAPVALGALVVLHATGTGHAFAHPPRLEALIALSGLVTVLPLVAFTVAARRLRYTTIGFFQYLAPTIHLLLAVLAYGEPFTRAHAVTFGLIGSALVLYTQETRARSAAAPAPAPAEAGGA